MGLPGTFGREGACGTGLVPEPGRGGAGRVEGVTVRPLEEVSGRAGGGTLVLDVARGGARGWALGVDAGVGWGGIVT